MHRNKIEIVRHRQAIHLHSHGEIYINAYGVDTLSILNMIYLLTKFAPSLNVVVLLHLPNKHFTIVLDPLTGYRNIKFSGLIINIFYCKISFHIKSKTINSSEFDLFSLSLKGFETGLIIFEIYN